MFIGLKSLEHKPEPRLKTPEPEHKPLNFEREK